jgi:hypothetical protein
LDQWQLLWAGRQWQMAYKKSMAIIYRPHGSGKCVVVEVLGNPFGRLVSRNNPDLDKVSVEFDGTVIIGCDDK